MTHYLTEQLTLYESNDSTTGHKAQISSFSIANFRLSICDLSWLPSLVVTDAEMTCAQVDALYSYSARCNEAVKKFAKIASEQGIELTGRDTPQARPNAASKARKRRVHSASQHESGKKPRSGLPSQHTIDSNADLCA